MKYPWMPLFLGDLLADTLHLSGQEFGAYGLLFCHAWKHDAAIPCEDLQRVARINNSHWYRVRPKLEPFFRPTTIKGVESWYHERVASELASAAELSNK